MEDEVDLIKWLSQIVVQQIHLDELESFAAPQLAKVFFFLSAAVIIGEGIKANNLMAIREQALSEVRPDESSGAGNQTTHLSHVVAAMGHNWPIISTA